MAKPKDATRNLKAVGKIGSAQFEGWGPNSGQAQIVINKGQPLEARFLLSVGNSTRLALLASALKCMWDQSDAEITYHLTPNLPEADAIKPAQKRRGRAPKD